MNLDLNVYKGKKIAVAMSGGVDSSVCAWMLKKAGADVFGITMKLKHNTKDVEDAKETAEFLGIPHHTADLQKEFEKEVVGYFVNESLKGKNPNPCVVCNQKIKFGALLREAEKLGAEFLATGHYARLKMTEEGPILYRPVDVRKDQSYAFSMLEREVFRKLIFPMGWHTKEEIKKIAVEQGIQAHDRPESQDLCFLDKEKGEFIKERTGRADVCGNIVDKHGNVLGKHEGIVHYTVGQRKGLGLKNQEKLYVVNVVPEKNEIVAGEKNDLYADYFYAEKLNWASIDRLKEPMNAEVLVRNKTEPKQCRIVPEEERVRVETAEPVWAVSPGQIAVFIKGDVVLGGGWIL